MLALALGKALCPPRSCRYSEGLGGLCMELMRTGDKRDRDCCGRLATAARAPPPLQPTIQGEDTGCYCWTTLVQETMQMSTECFWWRVCAANQPSRFINVRCLERLAGSQ